MSEPAFQAAIAANPTDWDLRSVYADWLEEQGRNSEADEQRKIAFLRDRPDIQINSWVRSGAWTEYIMRRSRYTFFEGTERVFHDLLLAGF